MLATPLRAIPGLPVRRAALRALNAALKRRPIDFEVVTPLGFRFAGNTRDVIQRHIYVFGVWEPDVTAWMRGCVRPGDLVVDVGANVGYFSLLAASSGAEVHAVEPLPSTVALLQRNVDLNQLPVSVHPVACSDRAGEMEMFAADAGNIGSASLHGGERSEGIVRTVALDEIVAGRSVALLKVDTEGHEAAVLRGAKETLAAMPSGAAVLTEIAPGGDSVLELMGGFDAFAIDNDYRPGRYADRRVQPPRPLNGEITGRQDVIFVKH